MQEAFHLGTTVMAIVKELSDELESISQFPKLFGDAHWEEVRGMGTGYGSEAGPYFRVAHAKR